MKTPSSGKILKLKNNFYTSQILTKNFFNTKNLKSTQELNSYKYKRLNKSSINALSSLQNFINFILFAINYQHRRHYFYILSKEKKINK